MTDDKLFAILDVLEQHGAKRALPDREPGWWTLAEIAQEYGASTNNKYFKALISKLVINGILEKCHVYDRENNTKCIVYRLLEKETEDDTPV